MSTYCSFALSTQVRPADIYKVRIEPQSLAMHVGWDKVFTLIVEEVINLGVAAALIHVEARVVEVEVKFCFWVLSAMSEPA